MIHFNCRRAFFYIITAITLCVSVLPWSLTGSTSVSASEYSTKFEHLSIEDGLSQSVVFSILQDKNGYIWFATKEGLNRYDGIEFTVFTKIPNDDTSISGNYINTTFADSKGNIWAGTLNGGLNRFNEIDNTFTSFQFNPYDEQSISHNYVSAICEDPEGYIWVATHNGLNRIHPESTEFTRYFHNPDNPQSISSNTIWSLFVDNNGIIWLGMDNGLSSFDYITGIFTHYNHDPGNPNSISNDVVRSILQSEDGMLWLGTYNGLNKFDPKTATFTRYVHDSDDPESISNNRIRAICEDDDNNLWIGTTDGLNKMDTESGTFTRYMHDAGNPHSISNNVIWSLLYDRSGILWVGTFNGGVNKLVKSKQAFVNYRHNPGNSQSISSSIVKCIYEASDGIIWVGTLDGLNKLDPESEIFTHYKHDSANPNSLIHNTTKVITQTKDGNLWIGTTNGLDRFDPLTETFTHFRHEAGNLNSLSNNIIWSLQEGENNILWIGTYNGFNKLDLSTLNFTHYSFDNARLVNVIVYDIYEKGDSLWLATSDGLGYLNKDTGLFSNYTHNQDIGYTLNDNNVKCIFEDSAGTLWFGTGGGLNKMESLGGTFKSYTVEDGLPSNTIFGILQDEEGFLWLSTNHGLSRFDPDKETYENYTDSDGLQSNEFSEGAYFKGSDGRLYFGGINGFDAFYPSEIVETTHSAPIVITAFDLIGAEEALEEPVSQIRDIDLEYKQNSFDIEFAFLDYTSPHSSKYSYKLIGFDEEWRYCTAESRIASYTNLDNGEYVFWIRASNNQKFEDFSELMVRINILAPFWKQWWFVLLCVAAAALLLYGVLKFRTRTIMHQKQKLERQVEKRTIQLREEITKHKLTERKLQAEMDKRIEFTRALVHELKTPLTTLSISSDLFSEEANEEPYKSLAKNINRGLTKLSKRIEEMLDLARGEIGLLRLRRKNVNLNSFMHDLSEDLTAIADRKGVKLICNVSEDMPTASIDSERIGQVISNLVDNAFKFTHGGGKVELSAKVDGNRFVVEVKDNGRGISKSRQQNIFSSNPDSRTDSERFGGLGLGLTLSKMLVELHGGKIWVRSKFHSGSTFAFSVPIDSLS